MSHARGIAAVGWFLIFGMTAASFAGITLIRRGTALDRAWDLNPRAYSELAPYGKLVGIPFLLFGALLAVSAAGWFRRRLWGWRAAVVIIATQILGDFVNLASGRRIEGLFGITIAGALMAYLWSAPVRAHFGQPRTSPRAR